MWNSTPLRLLLMLLLLKAGQGGPAEAVQGGQRPQPPLRGEPSAQRAAPGVGDPMAVDAGTGSLDPEEQAWLSGAVPRPDEQQHP